MQTFDCKPTLTDSQVLEFCKRGYLILESVVPRETNERTLDFLKTHRSPEPSEILDEPWFQADVVRNPAAAGAVRSLLGANFGLPILMSNHHGEGALPAIGGWHRDGASRYGPQLHYLQVFYYPQDTTPDMGPTELLPGSHFLFTESPYMGHYSRIRGTVISAAPAGSIFITVYSIWHRRSASTSPTVRELLKYNYWRREPPQRDWVIESDFDLQTADFSTTFWPTFRPQFRECMDAAEMFMWLCGQGDRYEAMGGQGWPLPASSWRGKERYGYPLRKGTSQP